MSGFRITWSHYCACYSMCSANTKDAATAKRPPPIIEEAMVMVASLCSTAAEMLTLGGSQIIVDRMI